MEELIQGTLERLAETGFSQSSIEAALNTTEFHLRENNTGRFPRGLSLMLRAMGNWIYDKDPYEALQWTRALDDFKVPCLLRHPAPPHPCLIPYPFTTFRCGRRTA